MKTDIRNYGDIRLLVDSFYIRAGADDLLGQIFSGIRDSHLHKESLYQYWDKVLLGHPSNDSAPFPEHIEQMFSTQHFIRWLTLFLDTIDVHYNGPTAEKAKIMVIRKSEEFQTRQELFRF